MRVHTLLIAFNFLPLCQSYDFFKWPVEPIIDPNRDPEIARTVFFIHMRKAAGTAVRQLFREIYQDLQCLPPKERKLVHSDQENWRCNNLAFLHVEWQCFAGSDIVQLRRAALKNQILPSSSPSELQLDSSISFYYPTRSLRFITCLRHPIDRLISINWYGESSSGMQFMKQLQQSGGLGDELTTRPEGIHKRTWYRTSVDIAKKIAAKNVTLWNEWILNVDQSTIWNYYISRLSGGSCGPKSNSCKLAARCLALGKNNHGLDLEIDTEVDNEHPSGCDALFTNDHNFPRPKFKTKRSSDPEVFGVEIPVKEDGPSPLARWVEGALVTSCDKHSHKVNHFVNRTYNDLEDSKTLLKMFDVVLISERLGDEGSMKIMEKYFGKATANRVFPNANRGLFTHTTEGSKEAKRRAAWQQSIPTESLKLMLQLNALDINLYWFADKLLDAQINAL